MASILVIGPHPDDQELGMGGTIALLAAQKHTVHLLDMTDGEPTPLGSPAVRQSESAAAAKVLGVNRSQLGLVNRQVMHDLPSRHALAAVIRQHRPTGFSRRIRTMPIPTTSRSRASRRMRGSTPSSPGARSPASRGIRGGSFTITARICA